MPQDTPQARDRAHLPWRVGVETAPGSNQFVPTERITIDQLTLGSTQQLSLATGRLSLAATDVLDAMTPSAVFNGDVAGPDTRLCVYRDRPAMPPVDGTETSVSSRDYLLLGYAEAISYAETGSGLGASRGMTLTIESQVKRHSQRSTAAIKGRWMRSAAGMDYLDLEQARSATDPFGDLTDLQCVEATTVVFNANGWPNRAAAPVVATIGGTTLHVYPFTDDADRDAEPWTFAQALQYLIVFHLLEDLEATSLEAASTLVRPGNVLDVTEARWNTDANTYLLPPVRRQDALNNALLAEPQSLAMPGHVFDALTLIGEAAGLRWCTRVASEDDTATGITPVEQLHIWARGAGTPKQLYREYYTQPISDDLESVLTRNNINNFSIVQDYSNAFESVELTGDVRRYEITAELIPGWLPDAHLDDVAAVDLDTEIDYALTHDELDADDLLSDAWYAAYRYVAGGGTTNTLVGRRWVLNESGRYLPDDYERSTGPFDDAAYAAWSPTDCSISDLVMDDAGDLVEQAVGINDWTRRGRPLLPCFSANTARETYGIYVQFSFDGGTTWHVANGVGLTALSDEAGILITAEDLTKVMDPVEKIESIWTAILQNLFRVKVTAVIEGDERLTPNTTRSAFGALLTGKTRQVAEPQRWLANRRDGGNSQFRTGQTAAAPKSTIDARVSVEAIQHRYEQLMEVCTAPQHYGSFTIPWTVVNDYVVGDAITAIDGLDVQLRGHSTEDGRGRRGTDIVAMRYTATDTTLVLEDVAMLDQVIGGAV